MRELAPHGPGMLPGSHMPGCACCTCCAMLCVLSVLCMLCALCVLCALCGVLCSLVYVFHLFLKVPLYMYQVIPMNSDVAILLKCQMQAFVWG